jgi:hypothetical protein
MTIGKCERITRRAALTLIDSVRATSRADIKRGTSTVSTSGPVM